MSLFRGAKTPPIDRRQSLASIPVLNPGVETEEQDEGRVLLTVPLAAPRGLLARFQPQVRIRHIRLDALGAFVVRQIDGRTSVLAILDAFVARYRVTRREAELCIADFLKSLARRQVISIVVKQ